MASSCPVKNSIIALHQSFGSELEFGFTTRPIPARRITFPIRRTCSWPPNPTVQGIAFATPDRTSRSSPAMRSRTSTPSLITGVLITDQRTDAKPNCAKALQIPSKPHPQRDLAYRRIRRRSQSYRQIGVFESMYGHGFKHIYLERCRHHVLRIKSSKKREKF